MKKLEFETSKGRFLLLDIETTKGNIKINNKSYKKICKLSEITEEQAIEIVFRIGHHSNDHLIPSAKQILHSLLKSKGVHLFENPYKNTLSIQSLEGSQKHSKLIEEVEQKTFYNPYIFKS